jgi:hypoxanthine phosphoribosyltransferase
MIEEIETVLASADCLYTEEQVEKAINRLAEEISVRLKGQNPLVLCLMNGAVIFTGKLLPQLDFPLQVDYIHASRYRGKTAGAVLEWIHTPDIDIENRVVLILDDVLDEGITLDETLKFCRSKGAKAVYSAVLVEKELEIKKPCRADFVGLSTGNRYLFGYGLDYKHYLRNVAGIYALKD